jgi:hypothetical protein
MVSARPRRDNTLWQRSRKRAPPSLQRPLIFLIIHRTSRGLHPYQEGDAVVTFQGRWSCAIQRDLLKSTSRQNGSENPVSAQGKLQERQFLSKRRCRVRGML